MGLFDTIFMPGRGYPFTERTRAVLTTAQDEAARLGHEYVGTEHTLLALVRDEGGVAAEVLARAGVAPERVRDAIGDVVTRGTATSPMPHGRPLTSRTKASLELATREARALHHTYVGTEHLLLGLLAERRNVAAQVLAAQRLTLERARALTTEIVGRG